MLNSRGAPSIPYCPLRSRYVGLASPCQHQASGLPPREANAVSCPDAFAPGWNIAKHLATTRDEAGPANYTTASAVARGRAGAPRRGLACATEITSRER